MKANVCLPFVLAALASGCSPSKPAAVVSPKVTVSHPQSATVTNWDEFPGHIEPVEMVEIRPRVTGYLESISFVDGQDVKAGDLLFVIDPKPYQADLDRALALRKQAETHVEWVRNDLNRAEGLRGTRAISEEEYDSRSKAVNEAEAALAAARAAEATAQLSLEYTKITAPVSGKIGRRLVTAGNLVQMQGNGATLLATIVSMDPIYCYFDVEESAFIQYRSQAQAVANSSKPLAPVCELSLVNEGQFSHSGRLDFFDNQVNSQSGTIRLRSIFDNHDRSLIPGMFATVRIPAGPPEPTLLVPDVAVQSDQGYKFVYLVNSEDKVEIRSIETGPAHGGLRSVRKGLTAQDRVVVNGLMLLRPDIKVEVETSDSKVQSGLAQQGEPTVRR